MRWLRRLWPKRLAGQMIALLLLALVLAQIATVMIFADERRFAIRAVDRSQLLGRAASVARLLETVPPSLHERILATAGERRVRYWLSDEGAVDDEDGDHDDAIPSWLAERWSGRFDREVRLVLGDDDEPWDRWWRSDDDDDGDRRERRLHRRGGHAPTVLVSMRLATGGWLNMESRLPPPDSRWMAPALTWLAIMGIAISAVVVVMIRRITRPMAALADAAERTGRGEAIEPLPEVGPADVRQTTSAFNRMQGRLQRFMRDRLQMLAAMSHDLRTPITTLRLRAEFIEDEDSRSKILETLDEMQRMTEATLSFVREEAAVEPTRTVDLAALIESITADLADLGHDVTFVPSERVVFACRPNGVKRALRNLIENAVRYGGGASIVLREADDGMTITVDDDGPGIPAEQIERMFEPFVRLDDSRNQETGGIGLGLAIARSIIRSHGGDIELANRKEGGLRATVTLPTAATQA